MIATVAAVFAKELRETFRDEDTIRVHPIITHGGSQVNVIPGEVRLETYVRGRSVEAILDANKKVDRAFVTDLPFALSFGVIQAGEWSSSVPDKLVAEGRFGVQIDEDPRQARQVFEDVVAEVAARDPWLQENRPVVTWPGGQFASG